MSRVQLFKILRLDRRARWAATASPRCCRMLERPAAPSPLNPAGFHLQPHRAETHRVAVSPETSSLAKHVQCVFAELEVLFFYLRSLLVVSV